MLELFLLCFFSAFLKNDFPLFSQSILAQFDVSFFVAFAYFFNEPLFFPDQLFWEGSVCIGKRGCWGASSQELWWSEIGVLPDSVFSSSHLKASVEPFSLFLHLFDCVGSWLHQAGCFRCSAWPQQLWCMGLAALWHVGSSFLDQGVNPHPLPQKGDSEPLDHQGGLNPWSPVLKRSVAGFGFSVCLANQDHSCCAAYIHPSVPVGSSLPPPALCLWPGCGPRQGAPPQPAFWVQGQQFPTISVQESPAPCLLGPSLLLAQNPGLIFKATFHSFSFHFIVFFVCSFVLLSSKVGFPFMVLISFVVFNLAS